MPNSSPAILQRKAFLRRQWPALLVWSCLLLLPAGRTVELPTVIMAIAAGVLWYRGRLSPWGRRYRPFSLVFMLFWIPMAASLTDAVTPEEAARVTGLYLRFYFAGLFIIWAIDSRERLELLLHLTALLLLFWIADALIQFTIGYDLFGYARTERINGPFGRHLKLGIVLAILAPFIFSWLLERCHGILAAAGMLVTVFVILAAGSRASWVALAIILSAYALVFLRSHRDRALPLATAVIVLTIGMSFLSYHYSETIAARIDQTLLLFSGDTEKIDHALSRRLPIWGYAVAMIRDHPVNGVGTRDFRNAYPHYATAGDYYSSHGITPAHPHQYVLEIIAETGIIGLAGLLLLCLLLVRQWRHASKEQKTLAFPVAVAMLATWFPINTHLAFYSSFMGQLLWWITALYFALLTLESGPRPEERGRI